MTELVFVSSSLFRISPTSKELIAMFTSCSPPVLRECINNNNSKHQQQQQQVIKHSVIKCFTMCSLFGVCFSVVWVVAFSPPKHEMFEENSSWCACRVLFSKTYTLNTFFLCEIHYLLFTRERFSPYTHAHV